MAEAFWSDRVRPLMVCAVLCSGLWLAVPVTADWTAEQRQEAFAIHKAFGAVTTLLKQKKYAAADEKLTELEGRIATIATAANNAEQRGVAELQAFATRHRATLKAAGYVSATDSSPAGTTPGGAPATGGKGVSFKDDIAPLLVENCLRCHGGQNTAAEFSVADFNSLLRGSQSGVVIKPGRPEQSPLYTLMAGIDEPRMPPGNRKLPDATLNTIKTWIAEGAKFDAPDPTARLSNLLPDEEEAKVANLDAAGFLKFRDDRAAAIWKLVLPRDKPQTVSREHISVWGNLETARLTALADDADAAIAELLTAFDIKATPFLPGRLTVFVVADRFAFDEFSLTMRKREAPPELHADVVVNRFRTDAYAVIEVPAEGATEAEMLNQQFRLQRALATAAAQAAYPQVPALIAQGLGWSWAAKKVPRAEEAVAESRLAAAEIKAVKRWNALFEGNSYRPHVRPAAGALLIQQIQAAGSVAQWQQLLQRVGAGETLEAAFQAAYRLPLDGLAQKIAGRR